jgi:uncharacterized phage protein (TIGR01671 family)
MKIKREIKFRVWDNGSDCWITSDSTDWVGTGIGNVGSADEQPWKCMSFKGEIMSNDNMGGFVDSNQKDYIIQQFIGLKDVNGKDIFEGDIIENQAGRKFLVEYVYNGYQYKEINKNKPESDWIYISSIGDESLCNVVGNIFENNKL